MASAAWGGSQAVAERTAYLAPRHRAWVSSRKRSRTHPLSRSNPGSDHNMANVLGYAMDFATRNGTPLSYAIARELRIRGYRPGSYTGYHIKSNGGVFRIQILWLVRGHYDHVHLGVRLVGGRYIVKKKDPLKGLSQHERAMVQRLLWHRRHYRREEKSGKGKRYRQHYKHASNWNKAIVKHMKKLRKDAKTKGKGGWARDNRGRRYQILDRYV